ncbi:MAG: AAA family ATPase, partial [Promethearchaeota archaeon]
MREKKKKYQIPRDKITEDNFYVSLSVQEAKKRDIGRNIARIDQETMEKLDIKQGEVIGLTGIKESAAIAWAGYPLDNGLGIIRIDSRLKKNTGANINDRIQISRVSAQPAQSIVLAPISVKIKSNPRFETFVKRKLHNYPATINDYIYISIGISRELMFKVINLRPRGVCIIKPETALHISEHITENEEKGADYVTYEDVGGLHKEIEEIREITEFNSLKSSLFNKLGINPPRGILLYGPPGCGKTLLTKAIAHESKVISITINGPDIIGKYYSDTERKLRNLFIEAEEKAPSIIIIDEIDSIAPKKESVKGGVEHRAISLLLSLLDGFEKRGKVIIIGITNKLNLIEPALLSPGRFDRIIEINLPDEKSREEIFRIHTKKIPIVQMVSLKDLARSTQNFSGADI